jgi:hypothetical protein
MQFGNGQDLKNILLGHLDVREGNVHFYFIYFSKSVHTHYTHNLTFNYEEVEMRIDDHCTHTYKSSIILQQQAFKPASE